MKHSEYAPCRERGPEVGEMGCNVDPGVGGQRGTPNVEYVYCGLAKGHPGPHVGNGFAMKRVTW